MSKKLLERLVVGSLYISLFCLWQMFFLAEPCSLAGFVILVVFLEIAVSHYLLNLA